MQPFITYLIQDPVLHFVFQDVYSEGHPAYPPDSG